MKLEVGMYVRTKDGIIAKVDYIDNDTIFFDKELYRTYGDSIDFLEKDNLERIVKASYNIIDILEIGDYVNGSPICLIKTDEKDKIWIYTDSNYKYGYLENESKSIVTKEQFEQMAYKVGD